MTIYLEQLRTPSVGIAKYGDGIIVRMYHVVQDWLYPNQRLNNALMSKLRYWDLPVRMLVEKKGRSRLDSRNVSASENAAEPLHTL